jgi:NitT/TauT family transport system substrate-binding protein
MGLRLAAPGGIAALAVLLLACTGGAAPPAPAVAPTARVPAAVAAAPATTVPASPAPTRLKIGYIPSAICSGIYLALDRGYFAEEGLELDMETFDAGERMIPSLATNQMVIGAGGLSAGLFGALSRGANLKVVAGLTTHEPGFASTGIVIRKDLYDSGAIRSFADMRGRTLGLIAPSSGLAIDMSRAFQEAGMSDADVNWETLSFPDQVPALANGAIDVSILTEPFVARVVQSGIGVRWKGMDEVYPYHQASVLMYAPDFPREQPEAAVRFLAAYLRGARDFTDAVKHGRDRAGVFRVLAEYTPIKDLSLYEIMVPSGIDPDGALNLDSMNYDQDWYLARGYVREKLDLAAVVDLGYRDAALQRVGRYVPRP